METRLSVGQKECKLRKPLELGGVPSFKVVIVGNEGVGKTSLLWRFIHNEFNVDGVQTLRVDIEKKVVNVASRNGQRSLQLEIWDTVGKSEKIHTPRYTHTCIPTHPQTHTHTHTTLSLSRSLSSHTHICPYKLLCVSLCVYMCMYWFCVCVCAVC